MYHIFFLDQNLTAMTHNLNFSLNYQLDLFINSSPYWKGQTVPN